MGNKLSEKEAAIYDALSYNEDTTIVTLYQIVQPGKPAPSARKRQMYVGKYISRLNAKLVGGVARPGFARASYRLYFVNTK